MLKIDESKPSELLDLAAKAVMLENVGSMPLKVDLIKNLLQRMPHLEEVVIDETSKIEDLEDLGICSRIRVLRVRSNKIKRLPKIGQKLETLSVSGNGNIAGWDQLPNTKIQTLSMPVSRNNLSILAATSSIRNFTVTSWQDVDLKGLSMASVTHFQVHGAKIASTAGLDLPILEQATFVQCRKLVDLNSLNAGTILIEGCGNVQLNTLASVKCHTLNCPTKNATSSLSFLRKCPNMQSLVIGDSLFRIHDIESISESFKLRRVSVRGLTIDDMVKLSRIHPNIYISNVRNTLRNGVVVATADFWK